MSKKIIIIGGGPGGYVAAIRAAQLGAEVTLVEAERIGGTCLNVGCIPTKAMIHVAHIHESALHSAAIGVKTGGVELDWPKVLAYQGRIVDRLVKGVEGLLKANKVTLQRGRAELKDAHAVAVDGKRLAADAIILATGSEPVRPAFPGADLPGVIDSTGALGLPECPGSMAILGGGVIGVEFASMYAAFGARVTIIEMLPQILPGIDGEIADAVRADLVRRGMDILTGATLTGVRQNGALLDISCEAGGKPQTIGAEKLLVAVGRRPRTQGLGLEAVGIATERGRIPVDANFQTPIPGIYAIGDCSSPVMLAHVASAQGIAAVEHALGHETAYFGHIIPACIYTTPEAASVGLSEEKARADGIAWKKGVFPLAGNGKSLIESDGAGMIKIIAGQKHGEILGVHIYGPRATDLIAEAALAMRLEATLDELVSTIHAHPTVSEALPEAALAVDGLAIHWPPGKKP